MQTAPTCIAGAACVPANACHVGTTICPAGENGSPVCQDTLNNAANGTACDDGNLCTTGDSCQAGVCTGTAKTCAASDQCHNPGVCNPSTGVCSDPVKADGSACNDGNACTQTDTCQAGACVGSNPVACAAPDQCHDAGTCNPASGICAYPNKADGVACNDGNACTQTDTCQAGVCTGSNPKTCTALDQCHDVGVCNPADGVCSNPNKANGSACNDGSACTRTDTCQAGACVGSNPVTCPATDQCHDVGTCNPADGVCSNPVKANGSACEDGNGCTVADTCVAGVCTAGTAKTCTASDQCHTAGVCDPASGTCTNPTKPDLTACDDGNLCTTGDTCVAGACTAGTAKTCTASDVCHVAGTCNPSTGVCSNPNAPNGTACDDANACTQTDTCQSGVCTGSNPKTCTALDQCHNVGVCDPASGVCTNPNKTNGSACNDGSACTQTDTCQAGVCTGSNPKVCVALDDCHTPGTCNPTDGVCSNPTKDDGSACTGASNACYGGTCFAVSTVNLSMVDQFWPDSGPVNVPYGSFGLEPEAFVPTSTGYSIIKGVTAGDYLSATIAKVPVGNYLLYTGPTVSGHGQGTFFRTAARNVDLGADELGRTNWTNTSAANTKLSFTITGLEDWDQTSDIAVMACSNVAQTWNFDLGFTMGAKGGTYVADWQYRPAIQTGDTAFLYQLHTHYPGGSAVPFYRVATRAVQLPPFQVVEGATTAVTAAMTIPATSASALIDWRTTQFEAALAAGNPGLPVGQHYFGVLAVDSQKGAGNLPYPYFPATARLNGVDLINIEPKEGTVSGDINLGTVGYYRFMPATLWQEARLVVFRSYRTFKIAPSTWALDLHVGVYQQEPMTPAVAAAAAAPVLYPPTNPTFSGTRTAPLLSWTAPAIGTPTSYLVQVLELYAYDTGTGTEGCTPLVGTCATANRFAATLYTAETQVQLPTGLLTAGKSYVAMVSALKRDPEPLTLATPAPRRHGVGYARADVLSDVYVP